MQLKANTNITVNSCQISASINSTNAKEMFYKRVVARFLVLRYIVTTVVGWLIEGVEGVVVWGYRVGTSAFVEGKHLRKLVLGLLVINKNNIDIN